MSTFTTFQLEIANKIIKYLADRDSYIGFDQLGSEIRQANSYAFQDVRVVLNLLAEEQVFIKFVNSSTKANVQLTHNGRDAAALGSIENWYEKQQKEKASNEMLQKKSIKVAESSANAAWFSGLVAGAALLLSLYQFYDSKQKEDEIVKIKSHLDSLSSVIKSHSHISVKSITLPDSTK